jgi:adenosine deaminase
VDPLHLSDLRALPKVDLHRHLEGAVRLSTIIELAREHGVRLPADTPEELAPHAQVLAPMESLEQALAAFSIAQGAFRSLGAVRRIAREAIEDLATDNVRLAELRFSPAFMCAPSGLDWDEALDAILEGIEEARSAGSDVAVGLVVIVSRDFGTEAAEQTVSFALRHRDHVVGFDLAGPELGYPPSMFTDVLRPILSAGIPLTAHYGESGPPEYPAEAIEALGAARLGHGVSVAHDPAVTALAVDRGVTLEMCPTSNWLTHAVPSVDRHPARDLLHLGASVTINTDDPALFGIDLTHEYRAAQEAIGFSAEDLRAVIRNALDATFIAPDVVADVRARHFAWLSEGA